jgi:RND superfamily putative drug exporter
VVSLQRTPWVSDIKSPLAPGNGGQASKDGRAALLTFLIRGDPQTAGDRVGPALAATAAAQRAHPNLFIGEFGDGSANKAVNKRVAQDFQKAEMTSLPVTLLILVLAFGALVAAGVPLLLGLTAVIAALGLTSLFSHLLHVDPSIQSVILLIGLAVGIDYSLFYLRREREERARGRTPADALQTAAATSGRAVLISGFTVMIAMMGMFLMGSQVFASFGVGTVLVVAISLVGSLTVLPAVLSKLGDRVDRGRIPGLRRLRSRDGESRFWSAIVSEVLRRPVLWGGAALALLVALAIPALSLHTIDSGAQGLPADMAIMKVYNRIQKEFPGGARPGRGGDQWTRRDHAAGDTRNRRARARGARDRPDVPARDRRRQRLTPRRARRDPAGGQRHRLGFQPRPAATAEPDPPRDHRPDPRRHRAHVRLDRSVNGLQ